VFGPNGNLFVASFSIDTNQVLEYDGASGAFVTAFVSPNSGGLNDPVGLVFGPNGNLFVASRLSNQVLEYDGTTGAFIKAFVSSGSGGLVGPLDLVFGPNGNLLVDNEFIGNGFIGQVSEYDGTTGAFVTAFVSPNSGGLSLPTGLVFGPNGNLFISSFLTNQVLEYNGSTGAFIDAFIPARSGGLNGPAFLTFGVPVLASVSIAEPATFFLIGLGLLGTGLAQRYLKRSCSSAGTSQFSARVRPQASTPTVGSLGGFVHRYCTGTVHGGSTALFSLASNFHEQSRELHTSRREWTERQTAGAI
jgi:hypothetical protein